MSLLAGTTATQDQEILVTFLPFHTPVLYHKSAEPDAKTGALQLLQLQLNI